jgi:hypothetical protein
LLEFILGFKIGMIFVLFQLPRTSSFERMSLKMWRKNFICSKGRSFNIPNLIPSSPGAVLLHKLKAASNFYIIIFFASHSNLSDDPSCISKNRGSNGGAIFDTNSGIQPRQLLAPVEEDLGFRNLLVILPTFDSLVRNFNGK